MSSDKPELSRAGTMQVTAKEGKVYLDKNLTDWKKPFLMEQEEEATAEKGKKSKMSKHTTMKGTAKEANEFLSQKGAPDEDVGTRGQQRRLDQIQAEKPATKKAKLARDSTMAATAKMAKTLLKGDKLGDTRQETKRKQPKGNLKRVNTADAVLAEAKAVYGDLDTSEGRSLRKRPHPAPKPAPKPKKAKKPAMKKANTMKRTAQEGEAFLERSEEKAD